MGQLLIDVFKAARALYVERFEAEVDALRSAGGQFICEPELLNADGEAVLEGPLQTGLRLDLVALEEKDSVRISVDSDRQIRFDSLEVNYGALVVSVSSFAWDNVTVRIEGDVETCSFVVARWFRAAFQSKTNVDTNGLQGAVHFISDPDIDGGTLTCVVDLGTAPAEALLELFDCLRDAGAARINLGSA